MNFIAKKPVPCALNGLRHYTLEPEQSHFTSLVADVTHRCNMHCENCYLPNRDVPDMDGDELIRLVSRLPRRTYIRLLGGEPTLRNDLPWLIKEIVARGHKPSLTTNALKLGQAQYVKELHDAGLRLLCLSMNGADDDSVYQSLDGGKYATLKRRALVNAFKHGFMIHTGTIVAKGINENIVRRQIDLVAKCAQEAGVHFSETNPWRRVPVVVRLKTIGQMGRYMEDDHSYAMDELVCVVSEQLGLDPAYISKQHVLSGVNFIRKTNQKTTSLMFPYETAAGKIIVRLIDWNTDANGVTDPGSIFRGRITQDWKVAPFFEDVRLNELVA